MLNYADDYKGIQWAPINYTTGDFLGWQGGFVNYTEGLMKGFQSGVVNCAGRVTGLQLGIVSYAEDADAVGLPEELPPGMIFVNWRF